MTLQRTDLEVAKSLASCRNTTELIAEVKSLEQAEIELEHKFSDGLYSRGGILPKDCVIIGRIHKTASLNYLLSGTISISENGKIPVLHEAPAMWESPAGSQKTGFTLTEVLMYNVYHTNAKTVESAEEAMLYPEDMTLEELSDDKTRLEP